MRPEPLNWQLAINARLVRADGIYVDGLDADGQQSSHASQEANALALAYGSCRRTT